MKPILNSIVLATLIFASSENLWAQSGIPVPNAATLNALKKEMKDILKSPDKRRLARASQAAKLGTMAQQEKVTNKRYFLLQSAISASDAANELSLSHNFASEINESYNVDDSFMTDWFSSAVKRTKNQAQIAELNRLFLESVSKLSVGSDVNAWNKLNSRITKLARKSSGSLTARNCEPMLRETTARIRLLKTASENDQSAAILKILDGDVLTGLGELGRVSDQKIAKPAREAAASKDSFPVALQQLMETLMASKSPAANLAAERIFESRVAKLNREQILRAQQICYGSLMNGQPLRGDFSLPVSGLNADGYLELETISDKAPFAFHEATSSWVAAGKMYIDWPTVPIENFVMEFEFKIERLGGALDFVFGTEDAVLARFDREKDVAKFRFIHYSGRRNVWKGTRRFKIGETLKFQIYRTPERIWMIQNGNDIASRSFGHNWLRSRIRVGENSLVRFGKMHIRPWLPGDHHVLRSMTTNHRSSAMTKISRAPFELKDFQNYLAGAESEGDTPAADGSFMNSFELAMRPVASGRFVRGYDDHSVQIQNDFWISAHEITQRQWSQLMNFNPSTNQGNPYSPVDNVSWLETASFCEALTMEMKKQGKLPAGYIYRLPTEAEWTFAALGGGENPLPVNNPNYWHWDTSEGGYHQVGVSGANKFGIFDMSGNVEEWTFDQFSKRSGKAGPDAEDIVDPVHFPPPKSFHAVVKGGSWSVGPERGSVTRRSERISNAAPNRGFRVVLAPAPKK